MESLGVLDHGALRIRQRVHGRSTERPPEVQPSVTIWRMARTLASSERHQLMTEVVAGPPRGACWLHHCRLPRPAQLIHPPWPSHVPGENGASGCGSLRRAMRDRECCWPTKSHTGKTRNAAQAGPRGPEGGGGDPVQIYERLDRRRHRRAHIALIDTRLPKISGERVPLCKDGTRSRGSERVGQGSGLRPDPRPDTSPRPWRLKEIIDAHTSVKVEIGDRR